MPAVWAISDIHLAFPENRAAFSAISARRDDWLILGGDVAEELDDIDSAFAIASERFARVFWVPGNHELWSTPLREPTLSGQAKYDAIVELARRREVLTPEDEFVRWTDGTRTLVFAPMFLLYDYTFRPPEVPFEGAIEWAQESGVVCADEYRLSPAPFATRQAWCAARLAATERRLAALDGARTVLINHFPLRYQDVILPLVPRFCLWCGTRATEHWHRRFNAEVVVTGHLHVPTSRHDDGTRFEEVSLGYPRQWRGRVDDKLRRIL